MCRGAHRSRALFGLLLTVNLGQWYDLGGGGLQEHLLGTQVSRQLRWYGVESTQVSVMQGHHPVALASAPVPSRCLVNND